MVREPSGGAPALQEGDQVAGYLIEQRIGFGGFGEVYRARHPVIGREVAIKVLHGKYSADPEAVARFVAEARSVNQISHPNIVEVFDFGKLPDGRQFSVMELIAGTTLRDVLRARTRLPVGEALPILRGIAEAVDAAHSAGIAHRDLKPDNVFVLAGGGIKLIDFGLVKLTRELDAPVTQTGSVFGTPIYMSPEQCRGKASDTRTDLYSFGVLAYHVLVGEPPFAGDALELALHHLNDAPVPPSKRCQELSRNVDRVVLALLAKNPADRPPSLVNSIDALAGATTLRARRWNRRARRGALVVVTLALAVAFGVLWKRSADPPSETDCPPASDRLVGVWDASTRAAIGARFARIPRVDVASTWRRLSGELDAYAARWSTLWGAACHAPDRKTDPLLYIQRQTCLDSALLKLRGVSKSLAGVDVSSFAYAFILAYFATSTAPLDDCTNVAVLREQRSSPPPELRGEVTQLAEELGIAWTQVRQSLHAGKADQLDAGLAQIQTIADRLEAIGLSGAAEASLRAGYLVTFAVLDRGRVEAARAAIADTIRRAEASHANVILAGIYNERARLELGLGGDIAVLEDSLARGEAALIRAGRSGGLAVLRAELDVRAGRLDHAVDLLRGELALPVRWLQSGAPSSQWAAPGPIRGRIVELLARLGRHDEAIDEARRAASAVIDGFGEDHMLSFWHRRGLERALFRAGRVADALAEADREVLTLAEIQAAPSFVQSVQLRRMVYALRLGRPDILAEARAAAIQAGATDRSIVEGASSDGDLELARAELEHVTTVRPIAIDDARATFAFDMGDLASMKQYAERVSPSIPATQPDGAAWFWGIENAPWYLAIADAAAGRRKDAEARLAALAPLHAVSNLDLRAGYYVNDGWVLAALGRWPDARTAFEDARALPVWTRPGSDSLEGGGGGGLAEIDAWLGVARLEAGDPKGALVPLDESLDVLMDCCDGFNYFAPIAELALARALWDTGGDKVRARYLAEQARDHFARLGTFKEPDRQRAIRWLVDHPAP